MAFPDSIKINQRKSLFRHEAQAAQGAKLVGEVLLVRPLSLRLLTALITCMALALVLLFVFGAYTRRTTVSGVVTPDTGLIKLYAQQAGIVLQTRVREGQAVSRGQVLYVVSTDLQTAAEGHAEAAIIDGSRQRKAALQREIDQTASLQNDERRLLQTRVESLRRQLTNLDDQIGAQRARTLIAKDIASRYENLLDQDYVSKDQAQQREADLFDQQSKLDSLQRDRAGAAQTLNETAEDLAALARKQRNELSRLGRGVMELDQSLIESEARRELVVTATEAGTAVAVMAEPGQRVDPAHPLASVVPAGARWQAHLFVPSSAVGFVHVGDAVLIRYHAYPYQKFGQYPARVVSIARTALSAAELAIDGVPVDRDGTFYRVIIEPQSQTVTAYGRAQPLQAGMTLQADILQERRRLYEWLLEPLYSMTGKL